MNNLSLTKIGNLKLGIVNDGQPIQTENILVTLPTKAGLANFKIFPGFCDKGEKKVEVSLAFNKPELNFEVNYVGFLQVDDVDYIIKASEMDEDLKMYPLYPDLNPDMPVISHGKLTNEKISFFNMERTGFLRVMLKDVSSFGEVFYLKTKSINSIRAISDQLRILDTLTDGNSAGIPLVIKPIKKDVNDKQIVYVSIGFEGDVTKDLSDIVTNLKNSSLNFDKVEEMYEAAREDYELVNYDDESENYTFKVLSDGDSGVATIITADSAPASKSAGYIATVMNSLEDTKGIPLPQFEALYNSFKGNKKAFEEFLENPENIKIGAFIGEISKNTKDAA